MLHWPLVRFGAASVLIGRPIEESLPFTAALGNQLLDDTRVVLGSDLETIGLVIHERGNAPGLVHVTLGAMWLADASNDLRRRQAVIHEGRRGR